MVRSLYYLGSLFLNVTIQNARFFSEEYTAKSDVWSFGILEWEIFSNGSDPYPELDRKSLQKEVIKGYRMKKPPGTVPEIAKMMDECWKPANDRPTFSDLVKILESVVKKYKK